MNINVAEFARSHFWEEPPAGSWEFWSFRFPPPCKVGDTLDFKFDGKLVARAVVARIEEPGQTKCERTGKFGSGWNVFWTPDSFQDLRGISPAATPIPPRREPVRPKFPAPPGAMCWCGRPAVLECQACKESKCMTHWWGRNGHSHTDRELIEREAAARKAVGK